jgi:hypothetical protein
MKTQKTNFHPLKWDFTHNHKHKEAANLQLTPHSQQG